MMSCLIAFESDISHIPLPKKFTFPFCYDPHPLAQMAVQQLQHYLTTQQDWQHDFGLSSASTFNHSPTAIGKMFGVLVVKNPQNQFGFLAAFSGKLAQQNHLPYFVPPVFDMLTQEGFFLQGTAHINALNQQIDLLEKSPERLALKDTILSLKHQAHQALETLRQKIIENRKTRKQQRKEAERLPPTEQHAFLAQLAQQSIQEKTQQKHEKTQWEARIQANEAALAEKEAEIEQLKQQRKTQSAQIQRQLFAQYRFLNQYQEEKSLLDIFQNHAHSVPPAGSGECAAPKLLHYAFQHDLTPIALAEFWWGASPKSEIRQHKAFYPACQNKCQPILSHMLAGIELEDNPLLFNPAQHKNIDIIYQDDAIVVVNKPAELLSVPGIHIQDSVLTRLQAHFPNRDKIFTLHRLDMPTSGLLVFALSPRANKHLQKQFIQHKVEKRYVALLAGKLTASQGKIHLPLRGDPDDRPRQRVCHQYGKPATTHWQWIEDIDDHSKVYLYPKTGRTHQLRVHCAHQDGLNLPILGDDLYGIKDTRLHLHAQRLVFAHPYTQASLMFESEADF